MGIAMGAWTWYKLELMCKEKVKTEGLLLKLLLPHHKVG
jgi:hypothetical protein